MSKGGWRRIAAASWGRPMDPQIYGDLEIDATELLAYLERVRSTTGVRVTVTHAVGRALGHALAQQPELNTRLVRGRFLPRDSVDIFFVASVGDGEEVSGVKIAEVDRKTLPEVATELARRVERIRTGELEVGGPAAAVDNVPFFVLRRALRFVAWLTTDRNRSVRPLGLPRQPFGSAMVTSVGMFGVQKAYGPLSPLYRVPILALVSEVKEKPVVVDGEIVARPLLRISGPAVMLGYLDNPEATSESLRTHADGRVWLHTGDIGRMDEDGFFTFVSRLKRMIKSSGFNVFPAQVEAVLYEHPEVVEACVIGVPDDKQGERVKAFVTVRDRGLEGPDLADELIAYCQERLIKWSCPREVEFLAELPKTRVGKIDFTTLSQRAAEPVA